MRVHECMRDLQAKIWYMPPAKSVMSASQRGDAMAMIDMAMAAKKTASNPPSADETQTRVDCFS